MQFPRLESPHYPALVPLLLLCLMGTPMIAVADEAPDFMQTILMYDPTLNNSFTLTPEWTHGPGHRELSVGWELDKALSSKMQISYGSSWTTENTSGEGNRNGITNSDLSLGYVFYERPEFQAIVVPSVSLHNGLGISEPQTAGLAAAAGGRLAMFGEQWRIPLSLQAIQFNVDMGTDIALGGSSNDVFADAQVAYSLPYLGFATRSKLPLLLRHLTPFLMINYDQPTSGSDPSMPGFFVTPGVAYQGDAYQVSTAVQMPMNGTADESQHLGITAAIIIYLDRIDPRFGGTLFQ